MKAPKDAYISGEKFRTLRLKKKLCPADLARKLSVTRDEYFSTDVKDWEARGTVPYHLLGRICTVLDCSLRDLMEE